MTAVTPLTETSPFHQTGEQLRFLRLCMVLTNFTPLFLLTAIRGNEVIDDRWLWSACALLILIPFTFLLLRTLVVWRNNASVEIVAGEVADNRSHALEYLLANMLPFYQSSIDQWRDLAALAVALILILSLFWHLQWHQPKWLLLALGYHVHTVYPPQDPNRWGRRKPWIVITRRGRPMEGGRFHARRITDTVYWETGR